LAIPQSPYIKNIISKENQKLLHKKIMLVVIVEENGNDKARSLKVKIN